MTNPVAEKDWKYLRGIRAELLATLCARINRQAMDILGSGALSEPDKYRKLYRYLHTADELVADCFDDWRRSTISQKLITLVSHRVLNEEQREHLTPASREFIKRMESLAKQEKEGPLADEPAQEQPGTSGTPFTPEAAKRWERIPEWAQQQILRNVFCVTCRGAVPMVLETARMMKRELILNGKCQHCGNAVARLVESEAG